MFSKRHKIMWSIAIVVIAGLLGIHAYGKYQTAPKPNPHPKYFVTISGNIEPHMPYPQTLMFRATYGAYNPSCKVWISHLEGVQGIAGHTVYYPAQPNAKGDYKVKIPIDAYKPGKCGWKIAWVMYTTVKHIPPKRDWNDDHLYFGDMIRFAHYKNDPDGLAGYPAYTNATMYCGNYVDPNIGCKGTELGGGYAKFDVLRNKSYHFIQNIKYRK
jgi:hypothetical protein